MEYNIIKDLFKQIFLIRSLEEKVAEIYYTDKIKSPVHLSIGQEAVSVGVCKNLFKEDLVFGTYRGHALYLAKGGDINKFVSELFGKISGCAAGRGGSMHLADKMQGVMGTSAIVSTTIPQAVGYALALEQQNSNSISCVFFGDGATEEGVFFESLNFAALKKLPILFVCENNKYAIHSKLADRVYKPNYCERSSSLGVESLKIGSDNVIEVFNKSKNIINNIRKKRTPFFLEIETSRWMEHVGPGTDFQLGYRNEEEINVSKQNDSLSLLKDMLKDDDFKKIKLEVSKIVDHAFSKAEMDDFPKESDMYTYVYQ